MYKSLKALALLIISVTIISSCGTSYVSVPVTRPAEVNMSNYKKITIGEFTNAYDRKDRYFESKLQTEIIRSNKFEVLDRKNIDKILTEKGMTIDGIIGDNGSGLGTLVAATALITGVVLEQTTNQDTKSTGTYKDKKGVTHTNYETITTADLVVVFNITDLSSGRIIYNTELKKNKSEKDHFVDRSTKKIDRYKLLSQAKEELARDFLKKIIPYQEYVSVPFKKADDHFEAGISYAQNGMLEQARDFFENQTKKLSDKEDLSKAHYNLGLCNMYLHDFDKATANFEDAEKHFHDEDYIKAHSTNVRMEGEYRQVQEQTK